MRPEAEGDLAPGERYIGVVLLFFCDGTDGDDKVERLSEIAKAKYALQMMVVNRLPAGIESLKEGQDFLVAKRRCAFLAGDAFFLV